MTEKPESLIPAPHLEELKTLCQVAPPGKAVELGVFKGGSAVYLAETGRELHLFDTFSGMPERSDGDPYLVGHFSEVNLEEVKKILPNAIFHVGVFPDTLTDDIKDIAFVHIDCDHYQTCKSAIELFWPRLLPGGIMAFDDFPLHSIRRAMGHFFRLEGLNFSPHGVCFVVKGDETSP